MEAIDTTPVEFPYENGREYFIRGYSVSLTVEVKMGDGTWQEVEGSPLASDVGMFFTDESDGGFVRITGDGLGYVSFIPTKR